MDPSPPPPKRKRSPSPPSPSRPPPPQHHSDPREAQRLQPLQNRLRKGKAPLDAPPGEEDHDPDPDPLPGAHEREQYGAPGRAQQDPHPGRRLPGECSGGRGEPSGSRRSPETQMQVANRGLDDPPTDVNSPRKIILTVLNRQNFPSETAEDTERIDIVEDYLVPWHVVSGSDRWLDALQQPLPKGEVVTHRKISFRRKQLAVIVHTSGAIAPLRPMVPDWNAIQAGVIEASSEFAKNRIEKRMPSFDYHMIKALVTWMYSDHSYCYVSCERDLVDLDFLAEKLPIPTLRTALVPLRELIARMRRDWLERIATKRRERHPGFHLLSTEIQNYTRVLFEPTFKNFRSDHSICEGLHIYELAHILIDTQQLRWTTQSNNNRPFPYSERFYLNIGGMWAGPLRCRTEPLQCRAEPHSFLRYSMYVPSQDPGLASWAFAQHVRRLTLNAAKDSGVDVEPEIETPDLGLQGAPINMEGRMRGLLRRVYETEREELHLQVVYPKGTLGREERIDSGMRGMNLDEGEEEEGMIWLQGEGISTQADSYRYHSVKGSAETLLLEAMAWPRHTNVHLAEAPAFLSVTHPRIATFRAFFQSTVVIGYNFGRDMACICEPLFDLIPVLKRIIHPDHPSSLAYPYLPRRILELIDDSPAFLPANLRVDPSWRSFCRSE